MNTNGIKTRIEALKRKADECKHGISKIVRVIVEPSPSGPVATGQVIVKKLK